MDKRRILVFGGSGGIGQRLIPFLEPDFEVVSLSSRDVDLRYPEQIYWPFQDPTLPIDAVLGLSAVNHDGFLHKLSDEKLDATLDVNVRGMSYLLREALGFMRSQGHGRIILASSILAERPMMGTGLYGASKAFLDHLVQTAALENARHGITVNTIRMGYFDAGLTHRVPEKVLSDVLYRIPAQRLGRIEELASAVRFLIDNAYVTGTSLDLTGGLSCA